MSKLAQFNTDEDLITALREGDDVAFQIIFRKYWYSLYNLAYAKLQSHPVAEEIVQALFVTLWEKRAVLLISNLDHYLRAAVKNRCISYMRKQVSKERFYRHYSAHFPEGITQQPCMAELESEIEKGIRLLPETTRKIFILNRFEGMANRKIATLCDVSEKSVEYHITRSLRALRTHLKDFFVIAVALLLQSN